MMKRMTVCGKEIQAEVFYHEHELRCTGCLRIERDRYKNALVDLRESPTSSPALKLWADNILRESNEE